MFVVEATLVVDNDISDASGFGITVYQWPLCKLFIGVNALTDDIGILSLIVQAQKLI